MTNTVENIPLSNAVKSDIQGFITSGFGHIYYSHYLFLQISDPVQVKEWLKEIEPDILSAQSWRPSEQPLIGPDKTKLDKIRPPKILNIAFTVKGLEILGLPKAVIETFPVEFQQGMGTEGRALLLGDTGDSAPEHWGIGNPNDSTHVVLILNAGTDPHDNSDIETFSTEQLEQATNHGLTVVHHEKGFRRLDDKELFGFHDGIAQPSMQGINIYKNKKKIENPINLGEFILGYQDEYGLFPGTPLVHKSLDPNNMLAEYHNPFQIDPLTPSKDFKDIGLHGSYIVYRKLGQNVPQFWKFILDEIERIDGSITSPERLIWLASKMVGRYPNGDPLTPHKPDPYDRDNFLFAKDDYEGLHCPVGSHIRRSNPRDVFHPENAESSLTISDKHRILRRGRNFGKASFDLEKLDNPDDSLIDTLRNLTISEPSGLHFLCVNANIQRQFEFIQHSWTNNPHFNEMYENKDPIIGDNFDESVPEEYRQSDSHMHIPTKGIRVRTSRLPRFVKVYGGAYLFMPSKTVLRWLATV